LMKRHLPGTSERMTLCGYKCTVQEYRIMKTRQKQFVNCKKCLGLLE
jgi:hypothetical protein